MPLTDSFDATSEEIIRASDLLEPHPEFPNIAIATFHPDTLALMTANFVSTKLPITSTALGTINVWELTNEEQRVVAYTSPMGAPFAAIVMEQLIALGVTRFVFFGECGVLDPAIPAGALVVPTRAWRDEGTSYHYTPAADWIDIPTAAFTGHVLDQAGIAYTAGPVWTTDAFFRETRLNTYRRRAAGCIAVDMECSALAAVAELRKVTFHQFLYAADSLANTGWDPRVLGTMPAEPRLAYARIALEIAKQTVK